MFVPFLAILLFFPGNSSSGVQSSQEIKPDSSADLRQAWQLFDRGDFQKAGQDAETILKRNKTAIFPSRGSAWFLSGEIKEKNKKRNRAFQIWRTGLDTLDRHQVFDPFLADAFVRSAVLLAQKSYDERITRLFYKLLLQSNARDQHDLLQRIYKQSDFLFGKEDNKRFKKNLSSRKANAHPGKFLREYWRRQDITPATMVNERLVEHLWRVEYSRINFPNKNIRGFDDRGMIYVRLGRPNRTATAIRGVDSRYLPHYVWAYDYISRGLYFPFVDFGKGKGYQLVNTIERAIPRMIGLRARIFFYRELGKATPVIYQRWNETLNVFRDAATPQAAIVKLREQLFYQDREELNYRKKVTPPDLSDVLGNVEEIPLSIRTARFMEPDSSTRFEIYLGFPRKQLRTKKIKKFMEEDAVSLNLAVATENKSFWPDTTFRFSLARITRLKPLPDDTLLYQAHLNVPNKFFYISGEVEAWLSSSSRKFIPTSSLSLQPAGGRNKRNPEFLIKIAGFRSPPEMALRLEKKPLILSDLQLSTRIDFSAENGNPRKNNLKIKPFPFDRINLESPVYLYFEIYGLKLSADDNRSHYKIAYEIKVIRRQKKIVSKLASVFRNKSQKRVELESEYSSATPTSKESIALDLKGLVPGRVVLTVIVTDLISGAKVRRSVQFMLILP